MGFFYSPRGTIFLGDSRQTAGMYLFNAGDAYMRSPWAANAYMGSHATIRLTLASLEM